MRLRTAFITLFTLIVFIIFVAAAYAEESSSGSYLTERLDKMRAHKDSAGFLLAYKPNYLIYTYNSTPNYDTADIDGIDLDRDEAKFQVSFMIPFKQWKVGEKDLLSLNLGFTQQSHFQVLNANSSRPVRESNYSPELMLTWLNDINLGGLINREITIGILHQSNGRSDAVPSGTPGVTLSRGWNRIYARFFAEAGDFYFILQPWWIMPHSKDDNEDIGNYYGNGDLTMIYRRGEQEFALLLRNNMHFDSVNRGGLQFDFSHPLGKKVKLYLQYYKGYGESLIDYNYSTERFGAGVSFTDWL